MLFRSAAATYTQWGVALTDMGRLTGMRTDLRLAIEKFKTSLRYRPGDANTLYHLACAHALCGDELLAAQTLKQCLAAATSDEYRNRARTNEDFKALHGNAELRDVFDVPGQWRPEPVKPLSR